MTGKGRYTINKLKIFIIFISFEYKKIKTNKSIVNLK